METNRLFKRYFQVMEDYEQKYLWYLHEKAQRSRHWLNQKSIY